MKRKIVLGIILAATLPGLVLTGCRKRASEAPVSGELKAKEVIVAFIGVVPKWQYEDDNGRLTGFEIELLRRIDELLPEYAFSFEKHEFTDALIAVENGKADLSVCQWTQTPERSGRFLFSDPYQGTTGAIAVLASRADLVSSVKSIDDLGGLRVFSQAGNDATQALEAWNTSHSDKPVIIDTSSGGNDIIVVDLKSGALDALVTDNAHRERLNEAYGLDLIFTGKPVIQDLGRFAINIKDTALLGAVNRALAELLASGEISRLSLEYIGEDLSVGL